MSKSLFQKYQELDTVDRFIVQMLALVYHATSRANLLQCWNSIKTQQGLEIWISSQFDDRIRKLINLELLEQQRGLGCQCNTVIEDVALRDAVKQGRLDTLVKGIRSLFPLREFNGNLYFQDNFTRRQEIRIAIYQQNMDLIDRCLGDTTAGTLQNPTQYFHEILYSTVSNPFDPEWIASLSPEWQERSLQVIIEQDIQDSCSQDDVFKLLEDRFEQGIHLEQAGFTYLECLWLQGYVTEAIAKVPMVPQTPPSDRRYAFLGLSSFLRGQTEAALEEYRRGLKEAGRTQRAKLEWLVNYPSSLFYFFAALKEGSAAALKEAQKYAELIENMSAQPSNGLNASMPLLLAVIAQQQGHHTGWVSQSDRFINYRISPQMIPALLEMYCLYWLNVPGLGQWLSPQLVQLFKRTSKAGYGWVSLEIAELLCQLGEMANFGEVAESLREPHLTSLISTIERKAPWELSLKALNELPETLSSARKPEAQQLRMAWRIRFFSKQNCMIAPIEQKFSAKGGWTKGKPIALKRLTQSDVGIKFPYMTDQDRRVCQCISSSYESSYQYYGGKINYSLETSALVPLVGHPYVYWEDNPEVRVEIVKGEPELLVKQVGGNQLHLQLIPSLSQADDLVVVQETPTRIKVIQLRSDHQRIGALLGDKNCLVVPIEAKERVLSVIASLSTLVTIQSDIGGGVAAEEVPADSTPRLHLLPAGDGLKVSILVHPFAEGGSYYQPGKGGATVIAEVEGKRLQTQRNLSEEKNRAKQVKNTCEVLQRYQPEKGEWLIDDPEDCLELLLQLQSLGDEIQIEWPQGEKFRVSRSISFSDFKFQIRAQQDWFAASGEVQISEQQVLDLQQLMELLQSSPGRFVQLSDGQFLALTDEFRKRLQTLRRLAEPTGKGLRVHGLAALSLEEMLEDVEQLKVDKAWKENLKRIKAAQKVDPQVPDTLKATLRDYQIDGYRWLARLAHWGVGACLADDMGLGKTIQVLTVILSRAQDGPTLVVAPTSVGMNWIGESDRFAPSLTVKTLGSSDRQKLLDNVGAHDLVVCSYGLLQQDDVGEMLAKVNWNTIVLDEAQAIKNAATKRSQTAMALQGNFKIITTGTPIENHLGELWNLFRFINPGLLGSLESFNQRFAYAIERDQDPVARDALRSLIQPFILRRTKDQVLKELPSRTEITLQVELSAEEMAFYEALRRESLEKLANSEVTAGAKHLQVLAEIMRLRRACCNPSLVRPELAIPSAKLEQFKEVLEELLDSGHKALVFSQFVDHLSILRNVLEEQKIAYQYLDGKTPAKHRKTRVEAFQNGEGDVFLISLKAGGTGLNLTAADYVIHMDPWWNPAVEDQASDRAHRIGQQRPVTIYRLVAKGTIEDKIVALHQTKRDLADSLLEGSDMSGKMSTDELLALLSHT